ncbi:MAG: hypothetical protein JWP21_3266, partial [Tardiphaga sp.]|nr:hypothetical protein [Tardiphaga sp.]
MRKNLVIAASGGVLALAAIGYIGVRAFAGGPPTKSAE